MKNLRNSLGLHVFILLGLCISAADLMAAQFTLPPLNPDKGRIFFYRDNSYGGGAVRPSIYLNNKVVGKSIPGTFFFIDQDPGPQLVSTTTEVENKVDFTILPGQTKFVRTSVAMGFAVGRVTPEVVENSIAANEIAEKTNFGPAVKKGAINTISNCSFKTQLQFLDGTKGCLENIPLAYEKASPSDDSILDTVLRSGNYAIARSKSNLCKAFGFAGDSGVNGGVKPASERVIDACNDLGCDCELIISGGGVLVSKDELIGKQASSEINLLAPITASPSVNKTSEETQNSKISSQPINQEFKKLIPIYKPDADAYYPTFSKREKEEGDVVVRQFIGEDGVVYDAVILRNSQYQRLDRAAIEIAKRYRYQPILVDGQPVKISTPITIKFSLSSSTIQAVPAIQTVSKPEKKAGLEDLNSGQSLGTKKLIELKSLLDKGLITQKDYDLKKSEILKSM